MKYKEFEISLINKDNESLGLELHEEQSTKITIDLDAIIAFRQAHEDDKEKNLGGATIVYLQNDVDFWVKIPYKKFKELLNERT